ncbi:MAG: L,D-transpeptidase family protein, partial [Candidatus Binatia bacterium]|nr:L,D-transpeptidase family protein [Candidatus Binatia bacterium]
MQTKVKIMVATIFSALISFGPSFAEYWRAGDTRYTYRRPVDGSAAYDQTVTIIGKAEKHRVRERESLLDISRHYHLGYTELIQANPGIDPWVPVVGREIHIPSAWILPRGPYRGIVLNIAEMRLYFFVSDSEVMTFPLGIGMEGWDTPSGRYRIGEKRTNPIWYVPASIQKEMKVPRKVVLPGPDNPLGSHWMRLSHTSYGIHGTNNPWAVGRYVTHGCIRLYPEDISYLFP